MHIKTQIHSSIDCLNTEVFYPMHVYIESFQLQGILTGIL